MSPLVPRLDSVAQLAEVSRATASKALNGRPDVSPSTRDRVLAAAERAAQAAESDGVAEAGEDGVEGDPARKRKRRRRRNGSAAPGAPSSQEPA